MKCCIKGRSSGSSLLAKVHIAVYGYPERMGGGGGTVGRVLVHSMLGHHLPASKTPF